MILWILEGLVFSFVLLLVCVINIKDGPVGGVHYYEEPVKKRVVELGLITEAQIKRNRSISGLVLMAAMLGLCPFMVFVVNKASTFMDGFLQLTVIYLVCGLFDRIFIDWYWVGHTKAWLIPGTEDLMPYIHKESWIKKIVLTIVLYPLAAALVSWIAMLGK